MNIFGIGLPEIVVILVLALLIFGPKKLPEIGSSLGKAIKGFQQASRDFENEFKREAQQIEQAVKTTEPGKVEKVEVVSTEVVNVVPAKSAAVPKSEEVATASSENNASTPSQST